MQELLKSLDQMQVEAQCAEVDVLFLKNLFKRDDFLSLLTVHRKISSGDLRRHTAVSTTAVDVALQVQQHLLTHLSSPEAVQLHNILTQPHLKALLEAHDRVARQDFGPVLHPVPHEVDEDERCVKIVQLVKGPTEPLGATIQVDKQTCVIKIVRILQGGAADRCGMIQVGDEVHEVNGAGVAGKSAVDVVKLLSAVGPIRLKLVAAYEPSGVPRKSELWVKALFDYDPSADALIPCADAGLRFRRGDLLHVVCSNDPLWWQARKLAKTTQTTAALIPSQQLQLRKEAMKKGKEESRETSPSKGVTSTSRLSPRIARNWRKPKKLPSLSRTSGYGGEELLAYEEVAPFKPPIGQCRPIVLIGPDGDECWRLRQRLITSRREQFKRINRCTTRLPAPTEADEEADILVSREEFQQNHESFLGYYEEDGHSYGISKPQIHAVIQAGHVPVICVTPHALKELYVAEFMPYVVFIRPSALIQKAHSEQVFADDDRASPFDWAVSLEATYGHYFHETIVYATLSAAFAKLQSTAHKLKTEAMWVPVVWTLNPS